MTLRIGVLRPLLLVLCFIPAVAHAGWIENGMPLTQQFSAIGGGAIVSDGHAGSIVVFQVCRNAVSHIVAQRIDSLGNPLWGETGIDISSGTGNEERPYIVSDGAGGAIVIWQDYRADAWTFDLYAQRVSASGAVQWTVDGVPICTATERQYIYGAIPDGAGGAIVVWQDARGLMGSYIDIYAQRVDASGAVQWTADGVAICTAVGEQMNPSIDSDGAGGAIIAWQDDRAGEVYYGYADIYAQRVNAAGAVQWTADGVPVCAAAGSQFEPNIASDEVGGAIVVWTDYRNGSHYDIYGQRLNASGIVQWTPDGVAICLASERQQAPDIVSDGAGGAIVTWYDLRGGSYADIYSQRVNASGTVQWTANGVAVCSAQAGQWNHATISDGAGGAMVVWEDGRAWNEDIYIQRIDAAGASQWTANGVVLCSVSEDQKYPRIVADGYGGAIVAWEDSRNGNKDMYAQRVGLYGNVEWNADGVALCSTTGGQQQPQIAADGFGGAIITWGEYRGGDLNVYAQRLDDWGHIRWAANGVAVCAAAGIQEKQHIAPDGAGGAIIAWEDARGGGYRRLYAQRVNAAGEAEWATDGVPVCSVPGEWLSPRVVSDGAGGAIVVWHDARSGSSGIYAQRLNAAGAAQWNADGVPLCVETPANEDPAVASDGAGGAIVAWMDWRVGYRIFAQRVNASGAVQWTTGGVQLCASTQNQHLPEISSDGLGGAVITWYDDGNDTGDIYAQRVNASGALQWTVDGVAVCVVGASQAWPRIASDGAGGAIVTWADIRGGSNWNLYAQRVNASGAVEWAANGIPVLAPMGWPFAQLVSDGAGGAIAVSPGSNGLYGGVCAQRIAPSGSLPWGADGIALSSVVLGEDLQIASDGAGGGIVTWVDNRCGALIYAHRISTSGELVATTLQSWSASLEETAIRVNWTVSSIDDGVRFVISRASAPDWSYVEIDDAAVSRDGLSLSFTDARCVVGSTYKYRIEYEADGVSRRVLFETEAVAIPDLPVTLYQNHPNPFNPRTVVRFYLPEAQKILLDVYDVSGRRVARLAEGMREKGYHEVTWDGRNSSGEACSSGIYFTRLEAGKSSISRKMVLMR